MLKTSLKTYNKKFWSLTTAYFVKPFSLTLFIFSSLLILSNGVGFIYYKAILPFPIIVLGLVQGIFLGVFIIYKKYESRITINFLEYFIATVLSGLLVLIYLPNIIPTLVSPNVIYGSFVGVLILLTIFLLYKSKDIKTKSIDVIKLNSYKNILYIFIFFLAIRILIILLFKGSHIDEYLHIFTGQKLLTTGSLPAFSTEGTYFRGFYVSFFIGSLLSIFKNNLLFAQLIFLIIPSFNFFLLQRLCKKISLKNTYLYFVLFLYSIDPFVIFNHTYIRMFVFYELFLLLIINIACEVIETNSKKVKVLLVSALVFLNIFFILTKELENFIFIALGLLFFAFIYFFNNKKLNWKKIALLLIPIAVIAIIVLFKTGLIQIYLQGQTVYDGVGNTARYNDFFFGQNTILSFCFIMSLPALLFSNKKNKTLIFVILAANFLFLFHQLISPAYKVIRGILYFLPIFILVSMWSLENIFSNRKIKIYISLVLIIVVVMSSIFFFKDGPHINREIDYYDYSGAYSYLRDSCTGQNYGLIHSQYIADFYGAHINQIIYLKIDDLVNDVRFYKDNEGIYRAVYDNVPVITDQKEFDDIVNGKNSICIISADEVRNSRQYVTDAIIKELDNTFTSKSFSGIKIYQR